MKSVIVILILLGILDTMLIIACGEIEKRDEEWEKKRNGKIH